MSHPYNEAELFELFGALCNDNITSEEHAHLEKLLKADPVARQLYFDYLDVHLGLRSTTFTGEFPLLPVSTEPTESIGQEHTDQPRQESVVRKSSDESQRPQWRYLNTLSLTLATLCIAGIGILLWPSNFQPDGSSEVSSGNGQYVATLLKSADCQWQDDAGPKLDGQRLLSQELKLEQGLAEIGFESGVRIVLQGPARLSIESSGEAFLHSGRLVLHGGEMSAPFLLKTPHSMLKDIGTEYGAEVTEQGKTEVHVYSGSVQVNPGTSQSTTEKQVIHKGRAAVIDEKRVAETDLSTTDFVRQIASAASSPPDVKSGLLAWDSFDYETPKLGHGNGGTGFAGAWQATVFKTDKSRIVVRQKTAAEPSSPGKGGYLELVRYDGYGARKLKSPIRLDVDAVYYVSFLVQKMADAARGESQYFGLSFRSQADVKGPKKLSFGMSSERYLTMSHSREKLIVAPQLEIGRTYLYVGKIVASQQKPDQMMMRVFGPNEAVSKDTPLVWNCETPAVFDDSVFDHILLSSPPGGHYTVDEIRIGTTWQSVTSELLPDR